MGSDGRYLFPDTLRNAYERLLFPLAVYQFVDGRVITLLVSDGMCEFMEASRDDLVNHYDRNMFGNVHPEDREMLATLGARFAVKEGPYDIVYRDKRPKNDEYRYVHTIGKYHTMDDGSRVAFLIYADITNSVVNLVKTFEEANSPQTRFLDENSTPLIIVGVEDRHVVYSNAAAKRMMPPQVPYDSFITFQEYFYHDIPDAMAGLFDRVDAGPRRIVEPRTGRTIEVDVTESEWDGSRVYVVHLYEVEASDEGGHAQASDAADLRRKRAAFNEAMFSGAGNDLAYWQRGYQGIRVWDLTANRMVSSSGNDYLKRRYGEDMTYDEYLEHVAGGARDGGQELRRRYNRAGLLLSFENGIQPTDMLVELDSPEGVVDIKSHFLLLRAPESGGVYLRLTEENVTDQELNDQLVKITVEHEFDFVAYMDIEGNLCRMVFGGEAAQRSFSVRLDEYCETLSSLVGRRFVSIDGLRSFIEQSLDGKDDHSEIFELEDGSAKSVRISLVNRDRDIYYLRRLDVTSLIGEERQRERELAHAMMEAERANEAKSGFLSGMSHDIRTPLNGILGFTNFALQEDDQQRARDYMHKAQNSATLLLDIVNDVLDLSRIESGKMVLNPVVTNTREIGAAVVEALRPMAQEKGVNLIAGPHPDKTIYADKLAYQKIWLNLISNAIKYTPAGGTVRMSVEPIDPPIGGRDHRLIVEDNGIGMSEEFQKVMFEPFAQENRTQASGSTGTGLGLAIVKRIVDLLDGTIAVHSQLGKGTRYEIDVHIQVAQDGADARADEGYSDKVFCGKHVLLCEDNELNAEIARTLLSQKGMTSDWAHDGEEGVRLFEESKPGSYDCILMDGRMPRMDGRQATSAIRKLDRKDASRVPIIALTADAFEEDAQKNMAAGMNGHVSKPIVPGQLFKAMADCLAHGGDVTEGHDAGA